MRSLVACCVAGALLAGTAEPSAVAFTVGVLRRDAIVVPFATFDGKSWKNHWPEPSNDVDIPMDLHSVPKGWWGPTGPLDTWQVWAGPQPQTVHVRQPDWLTTYCQKQVGLRTDYKPRTWPPGPEARPYPKDGLAVSPPQTIDPIERISSDSAEGAAVQLLLRDAYNSQEGEAVTEAQREGADVRPDLKVLEALPITIESLYAVGSTRRTYWIESSREYKAGDKCAALFGSGWLMIEGGKATYAAFKVQMVPCNRQTLLYMLPLGAMTLPTGTYWIAQWSGWDGEAYGIFSVREKEVRQELGVRGGACPLN